MKRIVLPFAGLVLFAGVMVGPGQATADDKTCIYSRGGTSPGIGAVKPSGPEGMFGHGKPGWPCKTPGWVQLNRQTTFDSSLVYGTAYRTNFGATQPEIAGDGAAAAIALEGQRERQGRIPEAP